MRTKLTILVLGLSYLLATTAQADAQADTQMRALDEQLAKSPNDARLHHQRGELHRQRGDHQAALADYDRAEALDSNLHDVQLARGRSLLETNRPEQAIEQLTAYLARHPGHYQGLLLRARAYTRLGRNQEAQGDFAAALVAMSDTSPQVYLERAADLTRAKQLAPALAVLEDGIRDVGPVLSLEQAALELELALDRPDAALARIDAMLHQSSRTETLLAKKAAILEKAGRKAEARVAREQALLAIEDLPQAKRMGPTKRLQKELVSALERSK
jgi:predicted Zn-dependent protease